ncbi:O-methyltransferase-domain-containing protein [Cercophora scortea]|uniref:O-methyltransferase-domain-containing protein n=1 Tax=Cercophora scortea TaxID=314031 RepID=A0AAE0IZF3_9PEZI|nr:O-methyltransferase-domain-containing protein [Cercophora scortea]
MSATPSTPLSQLADEIASNAAILAEYIKANKLPQPSFDVEGPPQFIPTDDDKASAARAALIDASRALHTLAVGPKETTRYFCFNELYLLGAMQVLCHFRVPQNVPTEGGIAVSELALKTGLSESLLPRFLRMAAANFYFVEREPGVFAHTAWSKTLATDENMRACVWFRYAEMLPTVAKFVDMVEAYPNSAEPQDTAFHLAFGDTFFGFKEKHPDNMLRFGQFIKAFSEGDAQDSAESVAHAYAWETLPEGSLVVDVGGGIGHVSAAIAQAHPHLRFQIQDFGDLADEAASFLRSRGVADRVQFRAHNFFDAQPAGEEGGVTIYFLRNIMHNWSDVYCRRILKPIVAAMGPESRLLVCDIILPGIEPNATYPKAQETFVRAVDLTMQAFMNARERAYEDWRQLFASVDGRLRITDVVGKPKLKRDGLIETRLADLAN